MKFYKKNKIFETAVRTFCREIVKNMIEEMDEL